jgi:hypothetical protein
MANYGFAVKNRIVGIGERRPRRFTLAGAAINSLDLVPLASREGFGGLFCAIAVHLFMTKPAPRDVVPIKEDARSPVRETDFEAPRLGHDLVLDNSNWHPRGLNPDSSGQENLSITRSHCGMLSVPLTARPTCATT